MIIIHYKHKHLFSLAIFFNHCVLKGVMQVI